MKKIKISYSLFVAAILLSLPLTNCKTSRALSDKNILVTAPAIYNASLCKLINKSGMKAIPFPVIKTSIIEQNDQLDSVLNHLSHFSWVALPSRTAIKAFVTRANELNIALEGPHSPTYCAIGKDQNYLRDLGVESILDIKEPSPQGIVKAIRQDSCAGGKIAVLVPLVSGLKEPDVIPNFIDSLKHEKLLVTRVNAYQTELCHPANEKAIVTAINNKNIDLIAFTSSAEIEALLSLLNNPKEGLKVPIASFGPYTASNAKKHGLTPAFVASDYSSFEGYTEAIISYFKH